MGAPIQTICEIEESALRQPLFTCRFMSPILPNTLVAFDPQSLAIKIMKHLHGKHGPRIKGRDLYGFQRKAVLDAIQQNYDNEVDTKEDMRMRWSGVKSYGVNVDNTRYK